MIEFFLNHFLDIVIVTVGRERILSGSKEVLTMFQKFIGYQVKQILIDFLRRGSDLDVRVAHLSVWRIFLIHNAVIV